MPTVAAVGSRVEDKCCEEVTTHVMTRTPFFLLLKSSRASQHVEKAPNHEGLAIVAVPGETGKWLANGNTERKEVQVQQREPTGKKGLVVLA